MRGFPAGWEPPSQAELPRRISLVPFALREALSSFRLLHQPLGDVLTVVFGQGNKAEGIRVLKRRQIYILVYDLNFSFAEMLMAGQQT